MNSKNIEDVTNSPEDWEDFWHSPEKYGTWDTTSDDIVVNMDGGVGGSWKVNPKVSNMWMMYFLARTSSAKRDTYEV